MEGIYDLPPQERVGLSFFNWMFVAKKKNCFLCQTMSAKEKGKFDDMAKADKVRYDREMKDFGPVKGGKKKKDPNAPKRPP